MRRFLSRLNRWWTSSGALTVVFTCFGLALVGQIAGWRWLDSTAWRVVYVVTAINLGYGVAIVWMFAKRRRARKATR